MKQVTLAEIKTLFKNSKQAQELYKQAEIMKEYAVELYADALQKEAMTPKLLSSAARKADLQSKSILTKGVTQQGVTPFASIAATRTAKGTVGYGCSRKSPKTLIAQYKDNLNVKNELTGQKAMQANRFNHGAERATNRDAGTLPEYYANKANNAHARKDMTRDIPVMHAPDTVLDEKQERARMLEHVKAHIEWDRNNKR